MEASQPTTALQHSPAALTPSSEGES